MNVKSLSTVCLLSLFALGLGLASTPRAGKRLWVLQEAGRVVEYDPSTWAVIDSVKVPAEFIRDPDSFQINRMGQMLFCADPGIQFGNPEQHFPTDKVWLWEGRSAAILDRGAGAKTTIAAGRNTTVENSRRWALSSDGRGLYCFENEFIIEKDADGADVSVSTRFHAWETDLNGGGRSEIAGFSFPPCACGTGVCSETCPEAGVWFPRDGVGGLFLVNHWIPGQLDSTYQSTFVYQKSGGKWSARKLNQALVGIEDATQEGKLIVHSILDAGCCGWENEGNDQTILTGSGKDIVLFDERRQYANPDYDISFFTSNAGISPDGAWVAVTLASTPVPDSGIRLSDGGKANPVELARILQSVAGLPAVEVLRVGDPPGPAVMLPHAAFAGWLNERAVIVIENGTLVSFDVGSGARRASPIKAAKESLVFLR